MPFKKVGPDRYRSPKGTIFSAKEVRAYYATDGFKRQPNKPGRVPKKRG